MREATGVHEEYIVNTACFMRVFLLARTEDPATMEFCKAVQTRELQLLFEHIMAAPDDVQVQME